MELSDSTTESEDERTLSVSTVNLAECTVRNRSISESGCSIPGGLDRNSRWHRDKRDGVNGYSRSSHRFNLTHSVDRNVRDRSPVFFLEPDDWIRTEGSSPIPFNRSSSRLLGSSSTTPPVPCESSDPASASKPPPGSNAKHLRRSQSEAPAGSRASRRSRSTTPRGREEDRQRKVAIPLLCRRNAMMVGIDQSDINNLFLI